MPLPAARDLDGAVVRGVSLATHPAHDPLGEAEPDLVVVLELGMAVEVDERCVAGRLIAGRIESQAVALAGADVAVRPELRPGPREREVHVEEDGLQLSHSTTSWRSTDAPSAHAVVWMIVHPRARSLSKPSSAQSRSRR